jgi:hypothetical protein
MKSIPILGGIIVLFLALSWVPGCGTRTSGAKLTPQQGAALNEPTSVSSKEEATELVSKIRTNMTFKAISSIIPLSTSIRGFDGEHGGVWYVVPVGTNYFIHLRFEHPQGIRNPTGRKSITDCRLNYPPRLEER